MIRERERCDIRWPHYDDEGRYKACESCGGTFRRCSYNGAITQELAEVVRGGKHLLIHQFCMKEGEDIA